MCRNCADLLAESNALRRENSSLRKQLESLSKRNHKLSNQLGKPTTKVNRAARKKAKARVGGLLAQERGKISEHTALRLVGLLKDSGAWSGSIQSVRLATTQEDHAGVDLVVETNIGTITLQCKSSREGAKEVLAGRIPDQMPVVVVVNPHHNDEENLERVRGALATGIGLLRRTADTSVPDLQTILQNPLNYNNPETSISWSQDQNGQITGLAPAGWGLESELQTTTQEF